jgi:hypothetical protein
MADVEVISYTDPACPWSWTAERVLRRLQAEFADDVGITYVLARLAREISDPHEMLPNGLYAAAASGMPIDPRGWDGREGRSPRSTYPTRPATTRPSIAATASSGTPDNDREPPRGAARSRTESFGRCVRADAATRGA